MRRTFHIAGRLFSGLALTVVLPILSASAAARPEPQFSAVHVFSGGADGDDPGGLIADKAGNLYGVTYRGGSENCNLGCGTVFKISPDGAKETLYSFAGAPADGSGPIGIVLDGKGTIFGTTYVGGVNDSGIFFKLTADGRETVLHRFDASQFASGFKPAAVPAFGADGNLYGTTQYGGSTVCGQGCGTVFRITTEGQLTTIHTFTGADGWQPYGGVTADLQGYLYGTTLFGGSRNGGVVFKMDLTGSETVLHSFVHNNRDGYLPQAPPVLDREGNLYGGTTLGPGKECQGQGCGIIYKIARDGTETVLHSFNTGYNGFGGPGFGVVGGLVIDGKGNLYGTTVEGGAPLGCNAPFGCGSAFELTAGGEWKSLHRLLGPANGEGAFPYYGLVRGGDANTYYGTTSTGPGCCGMVFKIVK